MKTAIATYIVDSFTDEPFKGNPAGVCLLKKELTDHQMLSIAKELGLSETAFVLSQKEQNKYAIRFFSPKMEIPLCGHATLAASKVIFENHPRQDNITFVNIENLELPIYKSGDLIEMQFPVYNTSPAKAPVKLLGALGVELIINCAYNNETKILLIEIEDCEVLRRVSPDYEQLIKSHDSINGVLVTARSNMPNFDFESRYFWPWSGTNEDPVTGGTHTFLAKYWSTRLQKSKMQSFQCSERSGSMEVEMIGDSMMYIRSQAQIVLKGELFI